MLTESPGSRGCLFTSLLWGPDFGTVDAPLANGDKEGARRAVYEERLVRHPDAEDVILVNEEGELTESTIANIAVKLDGTWYTPPVAAGCLPGVYRASLLEEGRLVERPIPRHLLDECEGIALLNSVRLWRPALVVSD